MTFYFADTKDCIPTENDLCRLKVITSWKILGLQLGVKKYMLDTIEQDITNTSLRFISMISLWLKSVEKTTYRKLIEALYVVGEEMSALELCGEKGEYRGIIHS